MNTKINEADIAAVFALGILGILFGNFSSFHGLGYVFGFGAFYMYLLQVLKVPTRPINVLSIVHAHISFFSGFLILFRPQNANWIFQLTLAQSMAYFSVDLLVCWNEKMWVFHHLLAICLELCVLYEFSHQLWNSYLFLWLSEVGGVLYHWSRVYPDSISFRKLFLIVYGLSRVCLTWHTYHYVILLIRDSKILWGSGWYWIAVHKIVMIFQGIAINFLNYYFYVKQIQNYLALLKEKKESLPPPISKKVKKIE